MLKYKKVPVLIFAVLSVAFVSSCIKDDDGKPKGAIIQQYTYRYVHEDGQTFASAAFLDAGNNGFSLELQSPASVTINGDPMSYNSLYFSPYYKSIDGKVDTGIYVFTDYEQRTFTNVANLDLVNPIQIPQQIDSIKTFENLSFTWVGDPIGTNETVVLILNNGYKDYAYYFQEVGTNEVFINKFNWAVIGPGEGSISLERQKVMSLQEDTGGGGNITLGYSTGYWDVVFY
jgi:hypothetical protein